jgi:hypothetical protein
VLSPNVSDGWPLLKLWNWNRIDENTNWRTNMQANTTPFAA